MTMTTHGRRWPIAFLCGALVSVGPASVEAWQVRVPGSSLAGPVAIDAAGNVLAAIGLPAPRLGTTAAVVKLARRNGAERWRRQLRGRGNDHSDHVYDVQVAAGGDAMAGATVVDNGHFSFLVARIAGRDGSVRWRRIVHGQQRRYSEEARALALDPSGDVIAVGKLEGGTTAQYRATEDFAVVKLAGETGEERWRFLLNGSADGYDTATAVAVDAAGDVIAVGEVEELPQEFGPVVTVIKIGGSDGRLLWRHNIDAAWNVRSVALDAGRDVLVAVSTRGPTIGAFGVFKIAGVTGEPLWNARVSDIDDIRGEAFQVGLLPSGDVVGVGFTQDAGGARSLTAVRLDGSTGEERWRQLLRGNDGQGSGRALTVGTEGDPVVGGQLRNQGTCYDLAYARLGAATGEVIQLRAIDGTATASQCDAHCDYEHPQYCSPPRAGVDQDSLEALTMDGQGRVILAGQLSDRPHGREQGFVAAIRPRP
jgi:outer membrane protein assembly factor BamB